MKSILNRDFRYTPAAQTDIRKTIKREQARLKALAEAQQQADEEAAQVVAHRSIRKVAK